MRLARPGSAHKAVKGRGSLSLHHEIIVFNVGLLTVRHCCMLSVLVNAVVVDCHCTRSHCRSVVDFLYPLRRTTYLRHDTHANLMQLTASLAAIQCTR